MAVNQPIISDDQGDSAWKLEVSNQINNEEARVNALVARIAQLEAMLGAGGGTGGTNLDFDSVDTTPPSTLRISNRVLSGAEGTLAVINLVQLVGSSTIYEFGPMLPANAIITDTHQLYIGGQKLIESVDYNLADQVSFPGRLELTQVPEAAPNLMIELSIWSI